ncbi:MAG: ribonuclease E/G [Lachnospiraceae bacterium]|nr:ribonuclease E/G [Lachnospiraceae bacterium]
MSDMRYIITEYCYRNNKGVLSFSLDSRTNKMESINFTSYDQCNEHVTIGDIFVAKVLNVSKQIQAAFILYAPNKKGYLPIHADYTPVMTNRRYDGRILAGDEILVQLEKEAVRTKEPVFTMNLSLAGRYSVISYANTYKGVSKKCSKIEREQLRAAIPQEIDYGVVIRTNAASLLQPPSETEQSADLLQPVKEEILYLNQRMIVLIQEGIHRTCFSRIWQSPPLYLTKLRDEGAACRQVITDHHVLYDELKDFVALYMPEQSANISLYQDASYPLQKLYRVETHLSELLSKKVWLKSGAYLVIEKTEAMYVIDVNSGKNTTKKETAEYIYRINLEAAKEIMRQMRLRNLTGMILIDFINMEEQCYIDALLQELRGLAKKDHIQTTVVDLTALGLVEITRRKTTKSLAEQLGESS